MVHHLLKAVVQSAVKSTLRNTVGPPIQSHFERLEANAEARKKAEEEEIRFKDAFMEATNPAYRAAKKEELRK